MKNKTVIIILACVLVVSFVFGVTGAVAFAKAEPADNLDGASEDRLIGVFITAKSLDLESNFQENADTVLSDGTINASDSASNQGRVYATLADDCYTNSETGETATTKNMFLTA